MGLRSVLASTALMWVVAASAEVAVSDAASFTEGWESNCQSGTPQTGSEQEFGKPVMAMLQWRSPKDHAPSLGESAAKSSMSALQSKTQVEASKDSALQSKTQVEASKDSFYRPVHTFMKWLFGNPDDQHPKWAGKPRKHNGKDVPGVATVHLMGSTSGSGGEDESETDTTRAMLLEVTKRFRGRARAFDVVGLISMLVPFIIFISASYYIYTKHNALKEEGKETEIGMYSILCCVLFCCGCGSWLGLCWPIDEKKDTAAAEKS